MPWSPNVAIADQLSKATPGLASFDGGLRMVHLGDSSNKIWHSVFDGASWSPIADSHPDAGVRRAAGE